MSHFGGNGLLFLSFLVIKALKVRRSADFSAKKLLLHNTIFARVARSYYI